MAGAVISRVRVTRDEPSCGGLDGGPAYASTRGREVAVAVGVGVGVGVGLGVGVGVGVGLWAAGTRCTGRAGAGVGLGLGFGVGVGAGGGGGLQGLCQLTEPRAPELVTEPRTVAS
jgi:hypothetical protein